MENNKQKMNSNDVGQVSGMQSMRNGFDMREIKPQFLDGFNMKYVKPQLLREDVTNGYCAGGHGGSFGGCKGGHGGAIC